MTVEVNKNIENKPINQLFLYEYNSMFNFFINIIKKKKLPKCSILSGQKGLGKATFAYHLVNYLLSINEKYKYLTESNYIDPQNESYNLVKSNTHPNFFLIDNNESEDNIKIEQVRNLLKFLRNTTYKNNLKIILIDNVESLNLNAANALLKCLEEQTQNTFFILVQNNSDEIIDTIKSRCIEFKFFLSEVNKKKVISCLFEQHNIDIKISDLYLKNFYYETPGNLLNYSKAFENNKVDLFNDTVSIIYVFIDFYLKNGTSEILSYISTLIEKFYNDLIQKKPSENKKYFFNRSKILKLLTDMKKFNLDSKNTFLNIKDILKADAR